MPKSTETMEERIRLARIAQWQDQLDGFADEALKPLLKSVDQAQWEITAALAQWAEAPTPTGWSEARSEAMLDELGAMSQGIQNRISGSVAEMAGHAGSASLNAHSKFLSWDGRAPAFNPVAMTAAQVAQLAVETPVGGRLLQDWIGRTFDQNLVSGIKQEITTGMLKGKGYPALVSRIAEGWEMTRTEAVTLARTYVQSANVGAMQAVYRQNQDIAKGWKWCAAMEIGGKAGGGTCLRCAALDGNEYMWGEPSPEIPLHPRCRCVALPLTKTWRELGLDVDEMEPVYRPWTKSDTIIDVGRGMDKYGIPEVQMQGFHQGSFADLFPRLPREDQLAVAGPGRLGLIEGKEVKFSDLVDPATGRLRLLEREGGKVVGLKGFGAGGEGVGGLDMGGIAAEVPTPGFAKTMEEAEAWAKLNGVQFIVRGEMNLEQLNRFNYELNKIPEPIRQYIVEKGGSIRLLYDNGVTVDPTMAQYAGRWPRTPGAGGTFQDPNTRIVVNKLEYNHGSLNLVLHEHAHTLDSLTGRYAISQSQEWKKVLKTPGYRKTLFDLGGNYITSKKQEAFAEMFSYYYDDRLPRHFWSKEIFESKLTTKQILKTKMPKMYDFFERLEKEIAEVVKKK